MDKKKLEVSTSDRRRADDNFSVAPLMTEIKDRFNKPVSNTFLPAELKRLHKFANQALRQQAYEDDVYGTEVFVRFDDDEAYMYDMEVDPPQRIAPEGAMPYGFVHGFKLGKLPGEDRLALSAAFEEYRDGDTSVPTHSYLVPLAVEGRGYGTRLVDAPAPVGESDVEVVTQDTLQIDKEDIEQDMMHSLLNIIENDLFDDDVLELDMLKESIEPLQKLGFIKNLDDMTTALNYYMQKCLHDQVPWLIDVRGIMERIDDTKQYDEKTGERLGITKWVEEKLTVVGVALEEDEYRGIQCRIYATSKDDVLYRTQFDSDEGLVLYREDDDPDEDDDTAES
jgi:hypothetical protein